MVNIQAKILPIPIPSKVQVQVGKNEVVALSIKELSEEVLAELAEEFTKNLFEAAGKKL